eukprot:COSAG02_NODE_312_length_24941_cov_60.672611_6_plen_472_part_00
MGAARRARRARACPACCRGGAPDDAPGKLTRLTFGLCSMCATLLVLLSTCVELASCSGGFYRRNSAPPQPSSGCTSGNGWVERGLALPGQTTVHSIQVGSLTRSFRVHLPPDYMLFPPTPLPMLLGFHGYTDLASEFESYSSLTQLADTLSGNLSFIGVYPQGMGDINPTADPQRAGDWYSWNGGGCSQSPGRLGETCAQHASGNVPFYGVRDLHFLSCEDPGRSPGHWMTMKNGTREWITSACNACTCADDETFVRKMTEAVASNLCLDRRRYYATGFSWGSMYVYSLALHPSLRSLFAAMAPVSGGILKGFDLEVVLRHEKEKVSSAAAVHRLGLLDVHGALDTQVPANATNSSAEWAQSADGWFYNPVDRLLQGFAELNGCPSVTSWTAWSTPWSGPHANPGWGSLSCIGSTTGRGYGAESSCTGSVEMARCTWNGDHNWPYVLPSGGANLVWGFLARHALPHPQPNE